MPSTSRLVSFQDFEDSSWLNCALPYATQQGTNFNISLSKGNYLLEAGLLEQGWIVSIPDYEGPKAAGPQSGMATLDSIRAVLKSSNLTGIAIKDVAVTKWGCSRVDTNLAVLEANIYAMSISADISGKIC